jgi:hypothetical protein
LYGYCIESAQVPALLLSDGKSMIERAIEIEPMSFGLEGAHFNILS